MIRPWQGLALRLSVLRKSSRSLTLPAGVGTVTDFAHRAIHTAQATSESYGRKAAWTIHKMLEMIWNISFAVLRFLAVFRPFYILHAEVKLNETKKEERNQPIRYALSLLW